MYLEKVFEIWRSRAWTWETGGPLPDTLFSLTVNTHTHSLWICNLEDSQKSTTNSIDRRFLISKYFANIKRLKISARSTTCRTVRTQDRTDLASSSVNRSATWGHAHVLTMHTKRQQTKKRRNVLHLWYFNFEDVDAYLRRNRWDRKRREDVICFSSPPLHYDGTLPLDLIGVRSLLFISIFFFFLSFSSLLPPNALHFILLSSKSPVAMATLSMGGEGRRRWVEGWRRS